MNRDLTYLLDLEKTCKTILELVEGMSQESFLMDRRTYLAILYEITVTGEIVKRLSSQFRQENPNIAWKQIAGMRDKLIHDYNEVRKQNPHRLRLPSRHGRGLYPIQDEPIQDVPL
jgi:uncharacterized protein with HEPN domain